MLNTQSYTFSLVFLFVLLLFIPLYFSNCPYIFSPLLSYRFVTGFLDSYPFFVLLYFLGRTGT